MPFIKHIAQKSGFQISILKAFWKPDHGFPFLAFFLSGLLLIGPHANAGNVDHFSTNTMSPNDYLFGSNGALGDPVFDKYRTIDLNIDIGIGSDCGRISIKNTLQAALKNILDSKYLESIGRDILAASPMLMTCYFSPTWCAILKHAQLKANFLAQLRLNQCNAINKFVDQRVSDYYEERSSCIQKSIKKSDGNFETAMESCQNYEDYNISNWAGKGKSAVNKLIDSTAEWAGMKDEQSRRVVDLTKSFVGDTIIKRGEVSVDFGPRRVQLTPRTYLMEVKDSTFNKLCKDLLPKLIGAGGYKTNVYRVISNKDLKDVSGSNKFTLDHQTMLSLAYLPYRKRELACRKLSDALAMGTYTEDMGKTLDFISSKLSTNPYLPNNRKDEADRKRRAFKDQVELTLAFEELHSEPLNQVLSKINEEGLKYVESASRNEIKNDQGSHQTKHIDNLFFDCSDGIGCQ